jgi:hypothetical protein
MSLKKYKIEFGCGDKVIKSLSLSFKENTELESLLMCNFDHLKLSSLEKKYFSHKMRILINRYIAINEDNLLKNLNTLMKLVGAHNKPKDIYFKATGPASFICLASLFHVDMPKNVNINLHLTDCPISVFPFQFFKGVKLPAQHSINLSFNDISFEHLPSLFKTKTKRHLNIEYDLEDQAHAA